MMAFSTSRSRLWPALVLAAVLAAWLAGLAVGQQAAPPDVFTEPFRTYQIAFANGFESGIRYAAEETARGTLDPKSLQALAANENGNLRRLIMAKAKEYQQKLVEMNKKKQEALKR